MSTRVTLHNVTFSYQRHPAVHHVSGRFEPGTLTAITGPNGAGKSTLLRGIAGLLKPDEGSITREAPRFAYLPQAAEIARDFPLSVVQLVSSGFWHRAGATGAITPAMRQEALAALKKVGLDGLAARRIEALSAGQFQRALFARILVQDAPLILLDEPFTAIDAESTARLLSIVEDWHREGRTVLCVMHDVAQIRAHFPQCLVLARECIAWGPTAEALQAAGGAHQQFFAETAHNHVCERRA